MKRLSIVLGTGTLLLNAAVGGDIEVQRRGTG